MAEERRLVTVLFADVAGSTALGEQRDPEDVRALLARFYAIAKEVIGVHGGTLEKFIGDAVMAVFGLPQAHGDDAERALAAALELRDRVQADPLLGAQLPIRLGVNTGEVVATRDAAAGDFLITGDAVNLAARLEQAADPWTILCGERTAQAALRTFAFGSAAEIDAKGKRLPIRAFPLLAPAPPAAAPRVPLIGRDADLAQLELVARRAVGERRPFLVSLIAPAGIGKTRLLEEFLDRLPGLAPAAAVATAQCLPYGQRLTYWPLRAVLYRLADLPEDASAPEARRAILGWLQTLGVEAPERMAEHLAATVGLGEAEVADRAILFAAWRRAVEAAAQRTPLVLVFEDLHWSSDSLLDLFEFIMQPRGDVPLLMVALTRPELLDRRPTWGGGRRNYVSLALDPLPDEAVAALVEHLLGGAAPEVVARVVRRVEGNPFYAGEIVRSLIERVTSLGDAAVVEQALATLPDTVQATVLARLDLLPGDERRVLQLGAVFGRAFRAAGVAALAPDLAEQAGPVTDRLVARDLIRPSDTDRFAFRHIIIREVAYQTLSRAERARLHAAAGAWLEGRASGREDALAELIAYHYREAATVAGMLAADSPNAAQIRRKAVDWLTRAAEVAAGAAAIIEAARHLRAAIDLAEPDRFPELYERLGDVAVSGDARGEAYRRAIRFCREQGRRPDQELRVLASLLSTVMRFQATVETRPSEEEIQMHRAAGRDLLARVADPRAVASFLIADAFYAFWHQGNVSAAVFEEAEVNARRALAIAERLDHPLLRSGALDALGGIAQDRGDWEAFRAFALQRLDFEERLDLVERMDAYQVIAWASVALGDLDECERAAAAALAILQPGQLPTWALGIQTWRIYALTLGGHWDEAMAAADQGYRLWLELGRPAGGYTLRGFIPALDIALAHQDVGLAERYRGLLREILPQLASHLPFSLVQGYPEGDLARLESEIIPNFELARIRIELVERTLSLLADHGRPPARQAITPILQFTSSQSLRILEAQARRAVGLAERDVVELERALEIFDRTDAMPYAARVRCELALLTGDSAGLAVGLKTLESFGDLDQLARMERARRTD